MPTFNLLQLNTSTGEIEEVAVSVGGLADAQVTATNSSGSSIAAFKAVNIYNNSGVLTMRLADSTTSGNNYVVHGFTLTSVSNGSTGTVQLKFRLPGFTGLTIGQYFSDPTTAGGITATPTNTSNTYLQKIGFAISTTELYIDPGPAFKQV